MTGKSPFTVLYSRNPRVLPNSADYYSIPNPAAEDFVKMMSQIHKETRDALEKVADNMKAQYDKKKKDAREYHAGD